MVLLAVEMMPIVKACFLDPTQEVRTFEDNLATEFATNQTCNSVHFVYFKNLDEKNKAAYDAIKGPHWMLMLNYTPGAKVQNWSMVRSGERSAFARSEDGPKEIAREVCNIAKEQGASLAN